MNVNGKAFVRDEKKNTYVLRTEYNADAGVKILRGYVVRLVVYSYIHAFKHTQSVRSYQMKNYFENYY